jgi:geranylgeranyl diphosphate synthase type II
MRELTWTNYMQELASRVEAELAARWNECGMPSRLKESAAYSLLAGGKRLRPIMTLAAAESLGADFNLAMPAACAVEMIHTYSLIHDDLPAMDNDDFRRGRPTNHRVFGEAMAILAGDALLTHAFRILADSRLPAERIVRMVSELSRYAGPEGMVGGQADDIEGVQGVTEYAQLEAIHRRKTGDMIVCALRLGGHAALAEEGQLAALERYGRSIGLAFQIQDDILDVTGDETKMGKSAGSDERQHKVTYPYLIGLERSRELVGELTGQALAALEGGTIPYPDRLRQLAMHLMRRDH